MVAFRNAVEASLKTPKACFQLGENGCLEYTDDGIGSDLLALSQLVRGGDVSSLASKILNKGDTTEIVNLFVLVFVTRNTRGGKGEKKLAYDLFLVLLEQYPETAVAVLPLFVQYGYWKDFFLMLELAQKHSKYEVLKTASLELVLHQWHQDIAKLRGYKTKLAEVEGDEESLEQLQQAGPKISLLAKWLPREGKSLDKKTRFVESFAKLAFPTIGGKPSTDDESWKSASKRLYRQQLAELTSFLALPEVLLAAQRADEIEVGRVASKATKLLTRAFLNEDKQGNLRSKDWKRLLLRDIFLDAIVEKGLKGGQVAPHEIVKTIMDNSKITHGMELALDAQWKDLWAGVVKQVKAKAAEEGIEFDPTKMVPISDVSGSMWGEPMEVSIALGIGISEITHDAFRNMVMTFSHEPEWFMLDEKDTIVEKVRKLQRAPWGMNTDFAKAYDLVLDVCEKNRLAREDMPALIVFSDMQFDVACHGKTDGTMFTHIRARVQTVANKLGWEDPEPTPIVFWNLRNTEGHPVGKDTEGTVLLSGFSPSLLNLVMNGEALKEEELQVVQADGTIKTEKLRVTPEQVLKKMLEDSMYDPVRQTLGSSTEGALKDFEWLGPAMATEGSDSEDFEVV